MTFPSMTALIGCETVQHRLIGSSLQVHVERCMHPQATLVNLVTPVLVLKVTPNLFHEVRRQGVRIMLKPQLDWLTARLDRLLGCNLAVFQHAVDYQITAPNGPIGVIDRRIKTWSLRQSCQQCRFFEGE